MMAGRFGLATAAAALTMTACAAPRLERGEDYCAPPEAATFPLRAEPAPPPGASESERVAALVGVRAVLAEHPRKESSRLLALERMESARGAIAATAAEIQCERDRAELAAEVLSRTVSSRAQLLTIGSIASAAASSILSAFLSTQGASSAAQDWSAIAGGSLTAGLAIAPLYIGGHISFHSQRNLLEPIWTGPPSSPLYLPVVWAYLTRQEFSSDPQLSIRQNLVERWRREAGLDRNTALAGLLFGAGGDYDVSALRTRAKLLEMLAAAVGLESQELLALAEALFV